MATDRFKIVKIEKVNGPRQWEYRYRITTEWPIYDGFFWWRKQVSIREWIFEGRSSVWYNLTILERAPSWIEHELCTAEQLHEWGEPNG